MITSIIILALALAVAIAVIATLAYKLNAVEISRDEHYNTTVDLRDRMSRVVMDKAKIEALYNTALLDNADQAQIIAALRAELEILKAEAEEARKQQEEPPTISTNSKITWTFDRLPEGKTNTFRCMDYRTITDRTSQQLALQNEDFTFSEARTGLRFSLIDGETYYHAALATAYGIDIGNTWRVTLDTGYVFNIIQAEYKHDISDPRPDDFGDPDTNYAGDKTTSVIEFVYDWKAADREIIDLGGMFIEDFGGKDGNLGNIVEMKPTGRKWSR